MKNTIQQTGLVLVLAGFLLASCQKYESTETVTPATGNAGTRSNENPSVPYVDMIASPESLLTAGQKISLGNAISVFMNVGVENREGYFFLKDSGIKILFCMDKSLSQAIEYKVNDRSIRFRTTEEITYGNLCEELYHAVQHSDVYKDQITFFRKETEFEAKVFRDLLTAKYATGEAYSGSKGQSNSFKQEYGAWIQGVVAGSQTVPEKFHYFCKQYASGTNPVFRTLFINKYFGETTVS